MKLKSLLIMAFAALSSAVMAQINYTFSDGNVPEGMTFANENGGSHSVTYGNLHVLMGVASNGKYRTDFSLGSVSIDDNKILAIKFNGTAPENGGTLQCKISDVRKAKKGKVSTSNNDEILYWDLSDWSESADFTNIGFIIADQQNYDNYSIDWIKTFENVDAVTASKDVTDDGDDDFVAYNETQGKGYTKLTDAVGELASGDVLTVRQNVALNNWLAISDGSNLRNVTVKGTNRNITFTRSANNMFFLASTSGNVLNIEDLTIQGENKAWVKCAEASGSGVLNMKNVTIKNLPSTGAGAAIQAKGSGTSTLENCTFINVSCSDSDKGVIFCGNSVDLKGNIEFVNCSGSNIYVENQYRFYVKDFTTSNPVTINMQKTSDRTATVIIDRDKKDVDLSLFKVVNDGYCLKANDKKEVSLAQGYAATIAPNGYATLYGDATNALTIPAGVEAYWGKVNGDAVKMTKIENGVIPANTAVVLYSESPKLYQFVKSEDAGTAIAGNDLKGSSTDVELTNGTYKYYRLTTKDDVLGFYPAATGFTSKAHKAYLELPASAEAKILSISFDDETTGIEGLTIGQSTIDNCMYNLAGQKVGADYKGIVIKNGKKYLVK